MIGIKRFVCGNLMANGYVIDSSENDCYIIDPGYEANRYMTYVKEKGLDPCGILLTHHHYDHSGVADRLRVELDCPVYMHGMDTDVYKGHVDIYLEGGETIAFGDEEFQVIHTPGHTHGGVCFMFPKSDLCFTGDTIFNVDLGRTDLEDGSEDEMIQSIRNVIDRWPNHIRIYPGHGDDCTMKTVRKINREFLEIVSGG